MSLPSFREGSCFAKRSVMPELQVTGKGKDDTRPNACEDKG